MRYYFLTAGILCLAYYMVLRIYTGKPRPTFSGFWLAAGGVHLVVGCMPFPVYLWRFLTYAVPVLWIVCLAVTAAVFYGTIRKARPAGKVPEKVDYVIILGASVNGTVLSSTLRSRLDAALEFLGYCPDAAVIVSGGRGSDESVSEAEAMAGYLAQKGVDRRRIIMEDQSSSTRENLRFSRKFFNAGSGRTAIVTSDFHMFRTLLLAGQEGYGKVYPVPAPSDPVYLPNYLIREVIASGAAALSGFRKNKNDEISAKRG